MPATVFPVPVDTEDLLGFFGGLGDLLQVQADYSGKSVEDTLAKYARAAQGMLERKSTIPFFVTRYCTRLLASQKSLVLGTGYDRQVQPLNYDLSDWRNGTGRMELESLPLDSADDVWLLLSGTQGKIAEVPAGWVERDDEKAIMHVIPHGDGFYTLINYLMGSSIFARGQFANIVPVLLHVRYSAGLVDIGTDQSQWIYASDEYQYMTNWWPELVAEYQIAIAQAAAGAIMGQLANVLDRGGVSVSLDGLSETVNPGVLAQRGQGNIDTATRWADTLREQRRGLVIAFA